MGWASQRPLYFSYVVHLENLSPCLFKMYSANCWFLITLNLDKEIGPHPAIRPTLLMSVNMFFHFVHVNNIIWTTFSPDDKVLVLCGIASANDTIMAGSVADAWSIASLGFFVPELP